LTERTVGYPSGPRPLCRPQRPGRGRMHRHRFLPYRFPKVAGRSSISSYYGPLALRQDSGGLWRLSSHETPDTLRQRSRGVHCGQGWEDRLDENLRAKTATRKPRDPGSAEKASVTCVARVPQARNCELIHRRTDGFHAKAQDMARSQSKDMAGINHCRS